MNKTEVINQLKKLTWETEIAEVICNIKQIRGTEHKDESIIVYLTPEEECSKDDLVVPCKHWTLCNNITDFKHHLVFGEEMARKCYKTYWVTEFKEVKPFKTDFD